MLLKPGSMFWQGMYVCIKAQCPKCSASLVEELKIGHAINFAYQIDPLNQSVFGPESGKDWLGKPLLHALQTPQLEEIEISKEVLKPCKQVVILNCIDFMYGHSLLKLLNASRQLELGSEYGLVVIVQKFLRWMIPEGVAEIWTVDIPLRKGRCYYPCFEEFVSQELKRFDKVYVNEAYSHPTTFDITQFTRIPKHNFDQMDYRVTFIWREDRIWFNLVLTRLFRKLNFFTIALLFQNWRIHRLFKQLKAKIPAAKVTVAGLGTQTTFPEWIEDFRVEQFDADAERKLCQIYSESRLVIGVHGSNMLLPSGHAGMTIDLMPNGKEERWGNFAQDILYQESDSRLAAYCYRYVSFETGISELVYMASSMILKYSRYRSMMVADKSL
jgi:hypothetical protein